MSTVNFALKNLLTDERLAQDLGVSQMQLAEAFLEIQSGDRQVNKILQQTPIRVLDVVALVQSFAERLGVRFAEDWPTELYNWASHRFFPDNFSDDWPKKWRAVGFATLDAIGIFLDAEKEQGSVPPLLTFQGLEDRDLLDSRNSHEYLRLMDAWNDFYIQEVLRLGREVLYFDLLSHIAGVHRVAVTVGTQLRDAGIHVDLPLLSGAARVHDIGKFGCRNEAERRRMAYLHYYYTEQWCQHQGIDHIGHIAMNHSTWDLELENLSVESLLLIYSDFRVKADPGPRGEHEKMKIYSLDDSFMVILNKLDNVDDKKRARYQRVYNKLADFEAYLKAYGVDVSLGERKPPEKRPLWLGMIRGKDTSHTFKFLAIQHNIRIMDTLADADHLQNMLEALRTSGQAVDIRANLNIFEEYITYMTHAQKELIGSYLNEMLIHPEGDIRRQSARLLGTIIATFDERFSKWLPDEGVRTVRGRRAIDLWRGLLLHIFSPDQKLGERYRRFQGYAFQSVIASLTEHLAEDERRPFLEALIGFYDLDTTDELTIFILLDALTELPFSEMTEAEKQRIERFVRAQMGRENLEIRLTVLNFYEIFLPEFPLAADEAAVLLSKLEQTAPLWDGEGFLKAHIVTLLTDEPMAVPSFRSSEVFLENLKTSTPWQAKAVNIRRLKDALDNNPSLNRLHVALHLSNLLKVSEQIAVRHAAGQMLCDMAPMLSVEEVNEVVVELYRGLEMDSFEFTKYIPEYLARFAAYLPPSEHDEFIYSLAELLDVKNETVAELALSTMAHAIASFEKMSEARHLSETSYHKRLSRMMGYIMKGLSGYHESLRIEALNVIATLLFGNGDISLDMKRDMFDIVYKRLLILMTRDEEARDVVFYGHANAFNQIYRFLSDYLYLHEELPLVEIKKAAFFPGTFDPFTLGHKEIVHTIRSLGFEVYIGLDEFSWSKNTQPTEIRRNILQMSVAGEENVMLFPPIFPVNIANPGDLKRLAALFEGRDLYLVTGSDVVRGASAYQDAPAEGSVHGFNHVIINRPADGLTPEEREAAIACINGKVEVLDLSDDMEGVSSTAIRANIDLNRDISHLIDRMAQNYIYDNNLYLGELKMKSVQQPVLTKVDFRQGSDVERRVFADSSDLCQTLAANLSEQNTLVCTQEGAGAQAAMVAELVPAPHLFDALGSRAVAGALRRTGASMFVVLSRLQATDVQPQNVQRVFTQALLWAMSQGATCAVYAGRSQEDTAIIKPVLWRHGFQALMDTEEGWYEIVDMRMPNLLSNNVRTLLKEPFASLPEVQQVSFDAHCRLQQSLTEFYPGELILSYDAHLLESQLAELISRKNGVPVRQGKKRVLGPAMCVPYGHLLRHALVANTVTRPLFVQRLYGANMRDMNVSPLPYYNNMESQALILHSFKRPVVLTDEVFNRGRTFELLLPHLKAAKVSIDSVATGIMTAAGRDLLEELGIPHHAIHHLPNIRYWLVDSKAYPFMDGYSRSDKSAHVTRGIEQAVNPVLPFAAAPFFSDQNVDVAWRYSKVCLDNARDIMTSLERIYQQKHERSLTLQRLPEVFRRSMMPDPGAHIQYDFTQSPSAYIVQDLSRLDYLANMMPVLS